MKELALQVTADPDHKFDLSLQLDDLDAALEIVRGIPDGEAETKWKAVGDRALAAWRFDLAQECYQNAGDLNAQLLILLSMGDRAGLTKLAQQAGGFSRVATPLMEYDVFNRGERFEQPCVRQLAAVG